MNPINFLEPRHAVQEDQAQAVVWLEILGIVLAYALIMSRESSETASILMRTT